MLSDAFTYTVRDTAGGLDQAQLVITLDMMAPYTEFGASPFFGRNTPLNEQSIRLPDVDPVVFIHPVVAAIERQLRLSNTCNDGTDIRQEAPPEIQSITLGSWLAGDRTEFVGRAVQDVRLASKLDRLQVEARQGVVSLSADGLLPDPSVFTPDPRQMEKAPAEPRDVLRLGSASAPSFGEQLKLAAQRFKPVAVNFHANRVPVETNHIS